MKRLGVLVAAVAALAGCAPSGGPIDFPARPAADFGDSVGINIRSGFGGAVWTNQTAMRSALDYTGIRGVRDYLQRADNGDGIRQRVLLRQLGQAGFRATLDIGPMDENRDSTCDPEFTFRRHGKLAELFSDPDLNRLVDHVEGPNEPDLGEPFPGWEDCLRRYQRELYEDVAGRKTVIGPAFGTGGGRRFFEDGSLAPFMDHGTIHPYPSDTLPESQRQTEELDACKRLSAGKQCYISEVGYHQQAGTHNQPGNNGVSAQAQAAYTLRMALHNFDRGIKRTDFYTLAQQDCGSLENNTLESADWGWYDCNWNPRPVAHAMHNFTTLVGANEPRTTGPVVRASWSGAPPDQRVVVLKAPGYSTAVLWREVPMGTAPVTTTLTTPRYYKAARFDPTAGTTAQQTWARTNSIQVAVGATPVVIRLEDEEPPPPDLTPTANFTTSPNPTVQFQTATHTSTSTGGDGPLSYQWRHVGGAVFGGNSPTATYAYQVVGTKTVELTVTDADGDSDTIQKSFENVASPEPVQTAKPCYDIESQAWGPDGPKTPELPAPGDMQHTHAGLCFPWNRVVSGTITLPVVTKMHHSNGRWLNYVRAQFVSDQDGMRLVSDAVPRVQCLAEDCVYTTNLTVNTNNLPTGRWEVRIGSETSNIASNANANEKEVATSGWPICVRSCSGRTPQNDPTQSRGRWFTQTSTGIEDVGYIIAQWGNGSAAANDGEFPYNPATGLLREVKGTWTPPVQTLLGSQAGRVAPVTRSRAWVDPDFHAGKAGTQVLNTTGPFNGRLSIDTTKLADGPHKLVLAAGSALDGHYDGVQVLPFWVNNP